jgi:hypothetical protein
MAGRGRLSKFGIAALTLALLVGAAGFVGLRPAARAAGVPFQAFLTSGASQVIPPGYSRRAECAFDERSSRLDCTASVPGDQVIAVHVHEGGAGQDGPAVATLQPAGQDRYSGGLVLSGAQVALLLGGQLYVDEHVAGDPQLTFRGQLTQSGGAGTSRALAGTPVGPTPTPPPAPTVSPPGPGANICGGESHAGGETVKVLDRLEVLLPQQGRFVVSFGVSDPGGEFVRVCYVEGNSAAFFDTETGRLRSLVINDPTAEPVLRAVVVTVIATPTPPASVSRPAPRLGPPNTGSGGLR